VEWSITGLGCSGTLCGGLIKDSYHARRSHSYLGLVPAHGVSHSRLSASLN
jgi:hypothetical protein